MLPKGDVAKSDKKLLGPADDTMVGPGAILINHTNSAVMSPGLFNHAVSADRFMENIPPPLTRIFHIGRLPWCHGPRKLAASQSSTPHID